MNVHQSNKAVAAVGMAIAIALGVVAFVVTSRPSAPEAAVAQATTPATVTLPAPASAPATPATDEFSSSAGRMSAAASDADLRAAPAAATAKAPAKVPAKVPAAPTAVVTVRATERVTPNPVARVEPPAVRAPVRDEPMAVTEPAQRVSLSMPTTTREADAMTSGDAAADLRIAADVKSAIADDSRIANLNIAVTSLHGVVTLSGHLASQDAIDEAKEVAGKVINVLSVDVSTLVLAST